MTDRFWLGMIIILLGGALNGSFALPMKTQLRWSWENTWLIFSVASLVVLPWGLAAGSIPRLEEVYRGIPGRTVIYPLAFGLLWGVAQLTYGLAIKRVGMALAISVVAGLSCLSGSLVPLLVLNPGDLLRPRGLLLLVGMPILFLGLGLYGKAGRRREEEQVAPQLTGASESKFSTGLAICVFTGIIGSSINLGFAFSGDLIRRSLQVGATEVTSTYAVWALVLGAGFVPNFLYCLFLLFRNRTWSLFLDRDWAKSMLVATAMALLWLGGVVAYGIGAKLVGTYGTSLGLLTAAQILSSSTLGVLAGEWRATSVRTRKLLATGLGATVLSVVVLNLGGLW
jgi:L-rhamnose-H+ transport protein